MNTKSTSCLLNSTSKWHYFPGLGYAMVIVNTLVALYYNVIIAWAIYYFFASMTSQLPWTHCDNGWNTDHCFTSDYLRDTCAGMTTNVVYESAIFFCAMNMSYADQTGGHAFHVIIAILNFAIQRPVITFQKYEVRGAVKKFVSKT